MKALINIYSNIQCVENNHSGLESVYLSNTYNMDLIGKAGRTNKHFDKFKDISKLEDLNVYDKIIIQLSQPNFLVELLAMILLKRSVRWQATIIN